MSYSTEQVLTYTPGYGSELKDIEINKIYNIESIKCCWENGSKQTIKADFELKINWIPKEGETHIDIDKSITFIDYLLVKDKHGNIKHMHILDNYGNIYSGGMYCSSDILLKKDDEMLSDQVIDYIKQNELIYNLNSDQIKQIQKIAGMGREKTIKYVMEYPDVYVEAEYDINDIIKELNIAFPGCDPWEKAKELYDKYDSMDTVLVKEYKKDQELLNYCVREKNNIEKLIKCNKDIDDEDIRELIKIKSSKLKGIESQIECVLENNDVRKEKLHKLNLLMCKLFSIPEKILTTEFI